MTTDEPEFPLAGLDAERPLPPELRVRLESALLAAVAGGLPVPTDEEALDAPRPLPEPVRARLESALLAETAAASAPSAPAASAPPAEAAGTVTSLDGRRRRKVVTAWSSAAAVLLLVVAVAGLLGRGGSGPQSLEAVGGPVVDGTGLAARVDGVPAVTTGPVMPGELDSVETSAPEGGGADVS
ncbi:MAG TPA: hypothetical protein VGR20_11340, partial [Acidimicrobiia bacterium]|nr:hypothetical protein [Acidimicrobiia bacterium]